MRIQRHLYGSGFQGDGECHRDVGGADPLRDGAALGNGGIFAIFVVHPDDGLDLQNRKTVLELLEKRLVANEKGEENKNGLSAMEPDLANHQPDEISFLEIAYVTPAF